MSLMLLKLNKFLNVIKISLVMSQKIVFNVVKMGFNVAINGFLRLHEFSMSQKNAFLMLKKSTLLMLQKKKGFFISENLELF